MGEKGSLELAPDRDQLIPGSYKKFYIPCSSYRLARDETSCTDLRSADLGLCLVQECYTLVHLFVNVFSCNDDFSLN